MFNEKERELKLLISAQSYETILKTLSWDETIVQSNTYYDDPEGTVHKTGAVRIREKNGHFLFTLKQRLDPITQLELEKEIPSGNWSDLSDPEILEWMKKYQIPENLHPIVKTQTVRNLLHTKQAEICLDETTFSNGNTDYELEYEYTQDHDGIAAFNEFLKTFGLSYEKNCPSKLARALSYQNL